MVLGDIQVMIQAPANKKNKGYSYALAADPSITVLKFQIWPPWDF